MKIRKALVMVFIIFGLAIMNDSVAHAAENGITVMSSGKRNVEVMSEEELASAQMEIFQEALTTEESASLTSTSSYTAYRYSETFNFYYDGDLIAWADAECIVWHYTDGKVHLYQRTIQLTKLISIGGARIYGSIVNTDGSYSYTTGDRIYLYLDEGTSSFAIDFYVSDTEGYFSCYEV